LGLFGGLTGRRLVGICFVKGDFPEGDSRLVASGPQKPTITEEKKSLQIKK
jgi:hypothetical protein